MSLKLKRSDNMKIDKIIILILLLHYCVGCSQNKNSITKQNHAPAMKEISKNSINPADIKKHIEQQANYTCDDASEANEYVFNKTDLDIALPLIEEMLQSNGYAAPEYSTFKNAINKYFKINIDESPDNIIIINRNDFFQYKGNLNKDVYDLCLTNLFIDKKRKFITPMAALTDIYDIKSQNVKQNLKLLLLNKYLFNDDKSGISYLVNNEAKFMYDMLVLFRFDELKRSNKKSITIFYENSEKYLIGDVIFNKNKNGELLICDNLLSTFSELYNESKDVKVILPLKYYSSRLIDNQRKDIFNNQEKIKILAYLANLYDPLFKQNHHDSQDWGQMTILADYKDFIGEEEWIKCKNEYKLNNYYGLPNLKSAIEYADMFDSVGAPD